MEFTPKRVVDEDIFTFNFGKNIAAGATILSTQVTISVVKGTDPSPQNMLTGSQTVVGAKVSALILGGIANNVYLVTCKAVTSAGQTLTKVGRFLVLADQVPDNLLVDTGVVG